jgi:archaellum component FlaC
LSQEGHERCIEIEQFQKLQELHDNQKKIIAKLQERVLELEQQIKEITLDKTDLP